MIPIDLIFWGAFGGFVAFLFNSKIVDMFSYKPLITLLIMIILGVLCVAMLYDSGTIFNAITATENGAAAPIIFSQIAHRSNPNPDNVEP